MPHSHSYTVDFVQTCASNWWVFNREFILRPADLCKGLYVCVYMCHLGFRSLKRCGKLFHSFSVVRSICQSVSPARRQEDQQEEDFHQKGRHEPHLQRSHDLLCAVHRPAGDTLDCGPSWSWMRRWWDGTKEFRSRRKIRKIECDNKNRIINQHYQE